MVVPGMQEVTLEVHRLISDVCPFEDATPLHFEAHVGNLWKSSGKRCDPERTLQIVIVEDLCREPKARLPSAEMNLHAVRRHRNRPEKTVRCGVRVVIVNLLCDISRSNSTVVDVHSDEAETCMIVLAVRRHVLANHEAHI